MRCMRDEVRTGRSFRPYTGPRIVLFHFSNDYRTAAQVSDLGDVLVFCKCGHPRVDRRTKALESDLRWHEACDRLVTTAARHSEVCSATPYLQAIDQGMDDGNQLVVMCKVRIWNHVPISSAHYFSISGLRNATRHLVIKMIFDSISISHSVCNSFCTLSMNSFYDMSKDRPRLWHYRTEGIDTQEGLKKVVSTRTKNLIENQSLFFSLLAGFGCCSVSFQAV